MSIVCTSNYCCWESQVTFNFTDGHDWLNALIFFLSHSFIFYCLSRYMSVGEVEPIPASWGKGGVHGLPVHCRADTLQENTELFFLVFDVSLFLYILYLVLFVFFGPFDWLRQLNVTSLVSLSPIIFYFLSLTGKCFSYHLLLPYGQFRATD